MAAKITTCCIKGCDQPIRSKALCHSHYGYLNRYGHPLAPEVFENYARFRRPQSKERAAWNAMKRRCYNPDSRLYRFYGARGITVCDRWLQSFEAFYDDMGPSPIGLSLDRINVNGNYEKSNCRWTTIRIQNRNRTDTVLTEEKVLEAHARLNKGETIAEIARDFKIRYFALYQAVKGVSWKDLQPGSTTRG